MVNLHYSQSFSFGHSPKISGTSPTTSTYTVSVSMPLAPAGSAFSSESEKSFRKVQQSMLCAQKYHAWLQSKDEMAFASGVIRASVVRAVLFPRNK